MNPVPGQEGTARPTLRQRWRDLPLRTHRIAALLAVLLAGLALIPWPRPRGLDAYELGRIQTTTVIAEFDFPVLKDPGELERERAERAGNTPAVVVRSDTAAVAAFARLADLRESVRLLRNVRGGRDELVLPLSQQALIPLLVGDHTSALLQQAELLLQDVMQRGFVSPEMAATLAEYRTVRIRDPLGDAMVPTDQLLTADRVRELARGRAGARGLPAEALAEVVIHCAVPNLSMDAEATGELVSKALSAIDPAEGRVLKGEKIIGAHERITPEKLRLLRSYEYWRQQRGGGAALLAWLPPFLGRLLMLGLAVGLALAYIRLNRPALLDRPDDLWLLALLEAIVLVIAAIFLRALALPALFVPVATISMVVTLLFDERLALAASMPPLLLIGVLGGGGVPFLIVIGTGAVATVLLTHAVRQRAQFFRHLAFLPLIHLSMAGALTLVDGDPASEFAREAAVVVANPLLAAALALFLLPWLEATFGRVSDISLREFQDLNRALLRRLAMTAPGTYHHSILVGTLAESAAAAVGANPLLARVIGYYHDIGKVAKPEYFPENIAIGVRNPHDRLAPSMSRLILETHVREGVAMAEEDRLPRDVIRGIREHHGVSLMDHAWRRARRQDPEARPEDFRYPGPRPASRESAIVLLANAVEEAARGLENPTPSRIKGLVHRVVQENLECTNLDDSGLSLSDIARARDSFVPMLAAAFRGRVQPDRGAEEGPGRETSSRRAPQPGGRS